MSSPKVAHGRCITLVTPHPGVADRSRCKMSAEIASNRVVRYRPVPDDRCTSCQCRSEINGLQGNALFHWCHKKTKKYEYIYEFMNCQFRTNWLGWPPMSIRVHSSSVFLGLLVVGWSEQCLAQSKSRFHLGLDASILESTSISRSRTISSPSGYSEYKVNQNSSDTRFGFPS